jgi:hypothetical protein
MLLFCIPIWWGICQRQGANSDLARMLWGMQLAHSQLSFVSPALSPMLNRHLVMSLSMVTGESLGLFIGTCLPDGMVRQGYWQGAPGSLAPPISTARIWLWHRSTPVTPFVSCNNNTT